MSQTFLIWPNDLDLNFHMNNGRYLTLMDLGRFDLIVKSSLLKHVIKNRWMPVLASAKIHFIKPTRVFQKICLNTQVIYWDEKWIYLEQEFWIKDQRVATALVKAIFLGKKEKIKPETILMTLQKELEKPAAPAHLLAWIEAENSVK